MTPKLANATIRYACLAFVISVGVSLAFIAVSTLTASQAPAVPEAANSQHDLRGHTGPVHALCFSADGKLLVSASGWPGSDNSVRIWDVDKKTELKRIQAPAQVGALALSPDGQHILAGTAGALLYIDLAATEVVAKLTGFKAPCSSVEFAADGKYAYSATIDGFARRWDLAAAAEVNRYRVAGKWARYAAQLPPGRVVTIDETGLIQIFNQESAAEVKRINPGPNWLASGRLVTGGENILLGMRRLSSWDLTTGTMIREYPGHTDTCNAVVLSPDGTELLSASSDGTARRWDVASGTLLDVLLSQDEFVFAGAYSPDGRWLAVAGGGKKVGSDYVAGNLHAIHLIDRNVRRLPLADLQPIGIAGDPATAPSASRSGARTLILILLLTLLIAAGMVALWLVRRRRVEE
jgi:WD40 repeat protein